MDVLFAPLCCVLLALGTGLGVAISFYAEKFLGRRAYVVGFLVPIIIFVTLYALYHLWLRLLSCTPVDRVCGEPLEMLGLIFLAVLCVVILANASAQFSLYLFRHRRDAPPQVSAVPDIIETPETKTETPETAESSEAVETVEHLAPPQENKAPE